MILFKEFLIEGAPKKHLHVFDIDDTLLHTNAKIHVKDSSGKTTQTLTNQEFNDHKLPKGHSYDFGEFRSAEKFAKEYGGKTEEWVKKTSSSFELNATTKIETHWTENLTTGQRLATKVKEIIIEAVKNAKNDRRRKREMGI